MHGWVIFNYKRFEQKEHAHTHAHTHTHTHTHLHTRTHTHTYTHIHICIHICSYIHVYLHCIHTYIHTYIHTITVYCADVLVVLVLVQPSMHIQCVIKYTKQATNYTLIKYTKQVVYMCVLCTQVEQV